MRAMSYRFVLAGLMAITLAACDDMGGTGASAYTDKRPTNINNFRTDKPLDDIFTHLERALQARFAEASFCLNKPAEMGDLVRVQRELGQMFPEDVLRLYQLADGQGRGEQCQPLFGYGYWFLSLDDMLAQWQTALEKHGGQMRTEAMYGRQGAVYGYRWHPSWIPVAAVSDDDALLLDFVPTPMGASGQVIRYQADETDRDHLAMSVRDYLAQLADGLEAGSVELTPDEDEPEPEQW